MKKINIGITISIKSPTESFFTNGIKQNAIILRDSLIKVPFVDQVYYINFGPQKDLSQSPWKEYESNIINFNESLDKVNLIICVGVVVNEEHIIAGGGRGIKFVQHVMGNEYYAFIENIIFKQSNGGIITKKNGFSANWISPHLYQNNKDLFEVLNNCKSEVAPYIWSPKFLMKDVEKQSKDFNYSSYTPSGRTEKRVSVFEPNIGLNKSCITPILSLEKFYKKTPNLLEKTSIFGSGDIRKKKEMIDFAIKLDINKNKKLFFEDRFPIAWALFKHSDVVLSYQKDCELNYLYFDAAWLGYPVIHNSKSIKELGWYYPDEDAEKASEQLIKVCNTFDKNGYYKKYIEKSKKFISDYLPEADRNVEGYAALIEKLL